MLTSRTQREQFKHTPISIPYPTKDLPDNTFEYDLWHQSLWDWCDALLDNKDIVSKFRWHAQRLFKWDDSTSEFKRHIDEPWTADAWWNIEVMYMLCSLFHCFNGSFCSSQVFQRMVYHCLLFYMQIKHNYRRLALQKPTLFLHAAQISQQTFGTGRGLQVGDWLDGYLLYVFYSLQSQ